MNILIVGSGAREHAIAKAIKRSPQTTQIFCCGSAANPGIRQLCNDYWIGNITDIQSVVKIAEEWKINLSIIGPEAPLEKGLADALWNSNIPTVGPKQKLARIETSKTFTRDLLKKFHIKGSPLYKAFHNMDQVKTFLQQCGENNYVIKANGLMGGKGVKVAGDHLQHFDEALQFCEEIINSGQTFLIEEKLIGQEFSLLCFCDGNSLIPMPLVQDHKRAFVNDLGPNTGGMGSYSDANHSLPFLTEKEVNAAQRINEAVLDALTLEYREPYIGILYGSFIATQAGVFLIECNARFGDPEALNILSLLESDFVAICEGLVLGRLSKNLVRFANLATVCKYAVPEGYPDHPCKNVELDISAIQDLSHLYLGAVDEKNGTLFATGSRTAAYVGTAKTIAEAEQIAEREIQLIKGPYFHRQDIGTASLIQKKIDQMKELRQS